MKNKTITWLADTEIEMEDYDPAVFNLNKLIERQVLQERKRLNVYSWISITAISNVCPSSDFTVLRQKFHTTKSI